MGDSLIEFSRRRRGGRGGGGFMGDGEIWGMYGMGGASIAAGEVAMLELGEMFDAVEAAPGDRLPLGRVTPAIRKMH